MNKLTETQYVTLMQEIMNSYAAIPNKGKHKVIRDSYADIASSFCQTLFGLIENKTDESKSYLQHCVGVYIGNVPCPSSQIISESPDSKLNDSVLMNLIGQVRQSYSLKMGYFIADKHRSEAIEACNKIIDVLVTNSEQKHSNHPVTIHFE